MYIFNNKESNAEIIRIIAAAAGEGDLLTPRPFIVFH
jgi:hypothetical protein